MTCLRRDLRILAAISRHLPAIALSLVLAACSASSPQWNGPGPGTGTGIGDPEPCTDPMKCCAPEDMVCYSVGGESFVCTCDALWDCSLNPSKCSQPKPTPPGGGDWDCRWTEFKYSCEQQGTEDNPPGGGAWTCTWSGDEDKWKCNKDAVPSPTPGANKWKCVVVGSKLVCDKDSGDVVPPGSGKWTCKDKATGKPCTLGRGAGCVCQKNDDGLPPGGGNWKCNQVNMGGKMTWVCYGEVPPGTPPGGGGWDCKKVGSKSGKDVHKCVERDEDKPPGGGHFSCVKGSEFNGTRCEELEQPPNPIPKVGDTCLPGTKMWCDGQQYCGWGQVTCLPNGSWPTRPSADGQGQIIDCQELANGARPNTVCACYHFYFNAACCERPDCLVPQGSPGQICPKSKGRLCDYCNPQKPECTEPGAYCLVTTAMETFCGKGCVVNADCPKDYKCVRPKNRPTKQCIPADYSCYY